MGGGAAWGGDLTFFKNLQSNSLPTGKSFQSNAAKFPHPRLHITVNPKAEPKKGTIKISPYKNLQSFINVAISPTIHVPVTASSKGYKESQFYKISVIVANRMSHTLIDCTCKNRLGFSLLPFTLIRYLLNAPL